MKEAYIFFMHMIEKGKVNQFFNTFETVVFVAVFTGFVFFLLWHVFMYINSSTLFFFGAQEVSEEMSSMAVSKIAVHTETNLPHL